MQYYLEVITSYPSGLFQKKIPGRGRRQAIYFSMGGWCGKFANYMGPWSPTKSNYMGCWYFAALKGKKEYYLPKKERNFIKSSQKKAQSLANCSRHGHFYPPTRKGSGDIAISLASVRLSVRRQKLVRSITFIPFEIF